MHAEDLTLVVLVYGRHRAYTFYYNGVEYDLIDTPGNFSELVAALGGGLAAGYGPETKLSGIIYFPDTSVEGDTAAAIEALWGFCEHSGRVSLSDLVIASSDKRVDGNKICRALSDAGAQMLRLPGSISQYLRVLQQFSDRKDFLDGTQDGSKTVHTSTTEAEADDVSGDCDNLTRYLKTIQNIE